MLAVPPSGDPRRRIVAESRTIAALALHGWALEADLGGTAPAELLERLIARGLPFGRDAAGGRSFDPAEAINYTVAGGLAGEEPAWRARFVATGQRLACTLNPTLPDDGMPPPRRFRVTFSRTFHDAGAGARLRLPRPIEDATLTGLKLTLSVPQAVAVAETPGRIELRPEASHATLVAGWTADFTSRPAASDPLDPAERALCLAPVEGLVRLTPRVRALAAALAPGEASDRAAVMAFHDHLLDRFACGVIAYEAIAGPATDHVLSTGWYDCQLGGALLVALARARGVPARLVGGYLLWPATPTWHGWCEVWLEGAWRPFDPIGWDCSAGGRDPAWRHAFTARGDYRMKAQILPRLFAGTMRPPVPVAHHRLPRRDGGGIAIDHVAIPDGRLIYTDRIAVIPAPA